MRVFVRSSKLGFIGTVGFDVPVRTAASRELAPLGTLREERARNMGMRLRSRQRQLPGNQVEG